MASGPGSVAASARIQSTFSVLVHAIDLSSQFRRSGGGIASTATAHSVAPGGASAQARAPSGLT